MLLEIRELRRKIEFRAEMFVKTRCSNLRDPRPVLIRDGVAFDCREQPFFRVVYALFINATGIEHNAVL